MKFKKYVKESIDEAKGASIRKQQYWEERLIDIQLELEDNNISPQRRASLEREQKQIENKFAKQREIEQKAQINESILDTFIKKYGVSTRTQQYWEQELEDIELQLEDPSLSEKQKSSLIKRSEDLKKMFAAQREHESRYMKESVTDMDRRCEKCNTLLNDGGTCPKCDDGEEDYGDEKKALDEELSNKEKLIRAFPGEFNFDNSDNHTEIQEDCNINEELSVREKLKAAYPELNFDAESEQTLSESAPEDDWYDDDYDFDDVEEDRRHAALYGGDRTYCNCGRKLVRTDWGSYCPSCDPETAKEEHERYLYDLADNV